MDEDGMCLDIITEPAAELLTTMPAKSTMTAVRFHGPGDIRVDIIEEPRCGQLDVKVKPAYVGICGSDIHEFIAGPVLIPQTPHPITGCKSPVTLGHEFSGIVEEVGGDIKHINPGQRVVVRPTIFDRTCSACKEGVEYCCENIGFIGLSGYGGGLAQHVVAPAEHFYPIPDNIPLEIAALVEPLAVAWHAVDISPFQTGGNVLVIGGGPIGIGVLQVLKLQGAKLIIVVELMESRKQLARGYGATHVLDPRECDIQKTVRELTGGFGTDVVFDTAGVEDALNGTIPACRVHGTIVNIADVIRALSHGQLNPGQMITSKIKLHDVVEKGFKALLEQRNQHCKILVCVQTDEEVISYGDIDK